VGVASGTDALILALLACGVGPGDEVAIPALSFFATAGAVCSVGAIPRVIDVDERGLMASDALDALDASRLRAVVPVHLFGNRCTAQRLGIRTVDDAAQAIGCSPPASFGELTAVSTYPTKMLSSAGDGGFVVGDRSAVERVRKLGNHGLIGPHLHARVEGHVGRNSRLDAVAAAVLLGHLPTLGDRIKRRQAIATHYDSVMSEAFQPLARDPNNPVPNYLVRTPNRESLAAHLEAHGIDSTVYYPHPLHEQPALVGRIPPTDCPVASRLCGELLAIPVHAGLTDDQVERVAVALGTA
jgi:dTDP-4-amino-4,6-dideoxygalactose transaminase